MFDVLKGLADNVVDGLSEITKIGIGAASSVVDEVVAGSLEEVFGDNLVSSSVRGIAEGAEELATGVVDGIKPLVKAVTRAPITKVERTLEVAEGLRQVVFSDDPEAGLEKAAQAGLGLAAVAATGGLIGVVVEQGADVAAELADVDTQLPPEWLAESDFEVSEASVDAAAAASFAAVPDIADGIRSGLYPPDTGAGAELVARLTQAFGMPDIDVYLAEGTGNAFCIPGSLLHGDEVIAYDPQLLRQIGGQFGPEAALGVLAHEVGHGWFGDQVPNWMFDWSDERRADYFAGRALARLGLDCEPLQDFLRGTVAGWQHPHGELRVFDVAQGYRDELSA